MAGEGRFYEAEFPEMDEIVVVQVKRIVDMGAYVSLLEYDNQEVAGKHVMPTLDNKPLGCLIGMVQIDYQIMWRSTP